MTKLKFVRDSEPLQGAAIRFREIGEVYETGEQGCVEVEFDPDEVNGAVEVEIETSTTAYVEQFDLNPDADETVVQIGAESSDPFGEASKVIETAGFRSGSSNFQERYELVGRLGIGGMGVVVKARDTVLERTVVIKVLSRQLSDYDEAREIFMRECRSLATLSHPNLVSVFDVVGDVDRPLMITEYVKGMTLEELIQSDQVVPQTSVLRIAVQLCRAVEYLHSEGVVHRDIKPDNVMLTEEGELKIIDFGLARSLQALSDESTEARGTPAFMAPEQIRNDERSEKIDLYQLGITLFKLVTGEHPFREGDVAHKHVHEEPPYLGDTDPNILPGLADMVEVCMAKDPDNRPSSATALRKEAERLHNLVTSSHIDRKAITDPNIGETSDTDLPSAPDLDLGPSPEDEHIQGSPTKPAPYADEEEPPERATSGEPIPTSDTVEEGLSEETDPVEDLGHARDLAEIQEVDETDGIQHLPEEDSTGDLERWTVTKYVIAALFLLTGGGLTAFGWTSWAEWTDRSSANGERTQKSAAMEGPATGTSGAEASPAPDPELPEEADDIAGNSAASDASREASEMIVYAVVSSRNAAASVSEERANSESDASDSVREYRESTHRGRVDNTNSPESSEDDREEEEGGRPPDSYQSDRGAPSDEGRTGEAPTPGPDAGAQKADRPPEPTSAGDESATAESDEAPEENTEPTPAAGEPSEGPALAEETDGSSSDRTENADPSAPSDSGDGGSTNTVLSNESTPEDDSAPEDDSISMPGAQSTVDESGSESRDKQPDPGRIGTSASDEKGGTDENQDEDEEDDGENDNSVPVSF